jgi:membrane dipeptidase
MRARRRILGAVLLGALPSAMPHDVLADTPPELHVVDLHVDVPYQVHEKGRAPSLGEGHASVANLRTGAYGGMVFPIYLSDRKKGGSTIADAEAIYATVNRIIEASPIFLPLLAREAQPGRITSFLSIEGAAAFAADPPAIDRFIARGVRLVGLVHAKNNPFASSATDKNPGYGLSDMGKAFAARIYEQGAVVDVSHLSDAGFADLVPVAEKFGAPIVATHSNARAIANNPRNLTDEQLRTIARTGGVAGLNFYNAFVSDQPKDATIADVVRQAEHMIEVAGIDHVAIGSDFDGGITPAEGLEDASRLPNLAAALRKRGMKDEDILKVFCLNALRVLAWHPAAMLERQHAQADP